MGQQGIQIESLADFEEPEIFAKSKNPIDSLVQNVHIFSEDINMQFRIKNCGVYIMEGGKIIRTDVIRLPEDQGMKDTDEAGYTYLGILEIDKIKEKEMKEKFSKEI